MSNCLLCVFFLLGTNLKCLERKRRLSADYYVMCSTELYLLLSIYLHSLRLYMQQLLYPFSQTHVMQHINCKSIDHQCIECDTCLICCSNMYTTFFSYVRWMLSTRIPMVQGSSWIHILSNDQITNLKNIREYGSTLYVGLARAVSLTNTNFRLTFLLTRL